MKYPVDFVWGRVFPTNATMEAKATDVKNPSMDILKTKAAK